MLITENLLLALLVFCCVLFIAGKIADHERLKPGPLEAKGTWRSSAEHLRPTAIIPLTRTTLSEQRTSEQDATGSIGRQVPQLPQTSTETMRVKELFDEWRISIVQLVNLGERNMNDARLRLEIGDHISALDTASTGVERMARALLHCFGEKADLETGQIEPLRLVSLRLTGEERTEFEAAIEIIAKFHQNVKAMKFLSAQSTDMVFLDTKTAISLCDSASSTVTLFAKMLHGHFAAEIPGLRECCPKCFSIDITLRAFNQLTRSYTCNLCKHKWTEQ